MDTLSLRDLSEVAILEAVSLVGAEEFEFADEHTSNVQGHSDASNASESVRSRQHSWGNLFGNENTNLVTRRECFTGERQRPKNCARQHYSWRSGWVD
ncbi:unnamed protein product [Phytophthora lilii]|uniref:Unnamed protein product n=1 Tax=Phytophthora lilii TaxID=2077276 RepID=A0A9W6TJQ0_9STRA|nr:unnamed protein product [Phytophthora lilii]